MSLSKLGAYAARKSAVRPEADLPYRAVDRLPYPTLGNRLITC